MELNLSVFKTTTEYRNMRDSEMCINDYTFFAEKSDVENVEAYDNVLIYKTDDVRFAEYPYIIVFMDFECL